jgi:PKD repeat protein
MKKLYGMILSGFLLASCSVESPLSPDALKACFTTKKESYDLNETIFFDGKCSQNAEEYIWYMGDGTVYEGEAYNYQYTESGTYQVSLVVKRGEEKDSIAKSISITKPDIIYHDNEAIYTDTYWEEGIHEIIDHVIVAEGTLTIAPGTIVRFQQDASMYIGGQGVSSLIAEGTAEKPILFTSANVDPKSGDWGTISFGADADNPSFKYCTFEYGGQGTSYHAMISATYGASFSMENSVLKDAANLGILMRDESYFNLFQHNEFQNIDGFAIEMDAYKTSTIGADNTFNGYGVMISKAEVNSYERLMIAQDLTLHKIGTPYVFTQNVEIYNSSAPPTLTLEPGVQLAFTEEVAINGGNGTLIARGTAQDSITFDYWPTAEATDHRWGGFYFPEGTKPETALAYCHIKNTGAYNIYGNYGAISMWDCVISVDHSTIEGSNRFALDLDLNPRFGNSSTLASFTNNVINCGETGVMRIDNETLFVIDKSNQFIKGTPIYYSPTIFYEDMTLKNLGVPYYFYGSLVLYGDASPTLTIEPGVHVMMGMGTTIEIGDTYGDKPGNIIAEGTAETPIKFTFSDIDGGSSWEGFDVNIVDQEVARFNHVYIEGAVNGIDFHDAPYKMLPNASVINSTFENIVEYGMHIVLASGRDVYRENNTFINVGWQDVK